MFSCKYFWMLVGVAVSQIYEIEQVKVKCREKYYLIEEAVENDTNVPLRLCLRPEKAYDDELAITDLIITEDNTEFSHNGQVYLPINSRENLSGDLNNITSIRGPKIFLLYCKSPEDPPLIALNFSNKEPKGREKVMSLDGILSGDLHEGTRLRPLYLKMEKLSSCLPSEIKVHWIPVQSIKELSSVMIEFGDDSTKTPTWIDELKKTSKKIIFEDALGEKTIDESVAVDIVEAYQAALFGKGASFNVTLEKDDLNKQLWQFEVKIRDGCGKQKKLKMPAVVFIEKSQRVPCCLPDYLQKLRSFDICDNALYQTYSYRNIGCKDIINPEEVESGAKTDTPIENCTLQASSSETSIKALIFYNLFSILACFLASFFVFRFVCRRFLQHKLKTPKGIEDNY